MDVNWDKIYNNDNFKGFWKDSQILNVPKSSKLENEFENLIFTVNR